MDKIEKTIQYTFEVLQLAYTTYFRNMIYPNKLRFSLFPKKHFTDEEYETMKLWIRTKIKTKETK